MCVRIIQSIYVDTQYYTIYMHQISTYYYYNRTSEMSDIGVLDVVL